MRMLTTSSRVRTLIAGALLVLIVLGAASAAYAFSVAGTQNAPPQPVPFSHQRMVQSGIPCLFCHTEARRSPAAGMPSVEKCIGCHRTLKADSPEIKQVAGYLERHESIPWVSVNRLPRFVYFSHQVHVAAGFNCERCHGDVGQMTVTYAAVSMDMGWCLSCHEQQSNAEQLKDCNVCHQ